MSRRSLLLVVLALAAASAGCGSSESTRAAAVVSSAPVAAAVPAALGSPTLDDHGHPVGLHNFHPMAGKITSGAQPEGDEAFRNLAALGFKTIISVDGAKPDLDAAKKYGLRYVHVPTQYSGTSREQQAKIAKAVEVSDGPVYVHCHHGKHRSPGATGAVCVSLGLMTPEQALAAMKQVGTDPKYKGLYRDTADGRPFTATELASVPAELPEYVRPSDLAASMVDVDTRWEYLKASKEAKWGVPPKDPDVDPPHEARMLWESYRELARTDEAKARGEQFLKHLVDAETSAKTLEEALRAKDAKAAEAAFKAGAQSCTNCHKQFRDN